MKKLLIISAIVFLISTSVFSQYYDFPFIGWQQTYTGFTWTGVHNEVGVVTGAFDKDSIIDGQTYVTNRGNTFIRSDQGKIYQNVYDWQTETFSEQLLYDFTLEVGDSFVSDFYSVEDSVEVISKERIVNLVGDSVWQLDLHYKLNWIVRDTFTWQEGVGDLQSGLLKTIFIDGGLLHACTLLPDNRRISVNTANTNYCNCTYVHGEDEDVDGFGNYIPRVAEVNLGFHFNNPSAKKNYKMRACDTLRIISDDLTSIFVYDDRDCQGSFVAIDNMPNQNTFEIYDVSSYTHLYLSKECEWDFAEIILESCFTNDCDDQDPNVNPNAVEIPNNGIDEDCDGEDLLSSTSNSLLASVNIYPNPASTDLHVEVDNINNFRLSIFDLHAKKLANFSNQNHIDISFLNEGVYFLEIINLDTGQRGVQKIVVSRK